MSDWIKSLPRSLKLYVGEPSVNTAALVGIVFVVSSVVALVTVPVLRLSEAIGSDWKFNIVSFYATALGTAFGIIAFWVALEQIAVARLAASKAADAATAAKEAAGKTLERVVTVQGNVYLHQLCELASGACDSMRSDLRVMRGRI